MDVNYLAILAAGVVNMIIGFLWYGPLFGKAWSMGMGWGSMTEEQVKAAQKSAGPMYLQTFVTALIMYFVFAHVLNAFALAMPDMTGVSAGIQGAIWMWLGFVVPVKYGEKLFGKRPLKVFFIDASYYLVAIIAAGIILELWK